MMTGVAVAWLVLTSGILFASSAGLVVAIRDYVKVLKAGINSLVEAVAKEAIIQNALRVICVAALIVVGAAFLVTVDDIHWIFWAAAWLYDLIIVASVVTTFYVRSYLLKEVGSDNGSSTQHSV
jgi:hypothetical protein